MTLERAADECALVAKAVHERCCRADEPVALFGWSFGNRPVRMMAHRHPGLACAVIIASAGAKVDFGADVRLALMGTFQGAPVVGRTMYQAALKYSCLFDQDAKTSPPRELLMGTGVTMGVQQLYRNALKSAEPADSPTAHAWQRAGGLPLLAIGGEADKVAPPRESGEFMASELPEQVTSVVVPEAAHMVVVEQPEAVMASIRAFLARTLPAAVPPDFSTLSAGGRAAAHWQTARKVLKMSTALRAWCDLEALRIAEQEQKQDDPGGEMPSYDIKP